MKFVIIFSLAFLGGLLSSRPLTAEGKRKTQTTTGMNLSMAARLRKGIKQGDDRIRDLRQHLKLLNQKLEDSNAENKEHIEDHIEATKEKIKEIRCERNRLIQILFEYEPESWHPYASFIIPGSLHYLYGERGLAGFFFLVPILGISYNLNEYNRQLIQYRRNTVAITSFALLGGERLNAPGAGLYVIDSMFKQEQKNLNRSAQTAQISSLAFYLFFAILSWNDSAEKFFEPAGKFDKIKEKNCPKSDRQNEHMPQTAPPTKATSCLEIPRETPAITARPMHEENQYIYFTVSF